MKGSARELTCAAADELAAAYALGAVDGAEERSISAHFASCSHPHAESHALITAAAVLPASLDPVAPPARLRDRLMETIAATPQDHRWSGRHVVVAMEQRRWWQRPTLSAAVAAVAVAGAVGLGAWGATLSGQLAERDAALRAAAAAESAYAISGPAGTGWVMERGGTAIFIADNVADLPVDRIYELWLIDQDGVPTAVGTFTDTEGVVVVPLERGVGDATTFAVTVEVERVEKPTTDPVLVGELDA